MQKLVTSTEPRTEEHSIDVEYKGKLSHEIFQKYTEFSTFYFFCLKIFVIWAKKDLR